MKAVRRGPSPMATVSLVLAAITGASGLTLFSLWALGVDLPFLARQAAPMEPRGFPIPVLARPLPAYTKITIEHFLDPQTGQPKNRYVSSKEEAEKNGFITDRQHIINRVLTRDKDAGFPFSDKDLYPKGTRAGQTAGIPVGKVGVVLAADKVQGIHALKLGDRFDLLASVPVDLDKVFAQLKLVGSPDPQAAGKRANVRVLVQNGMVVVPVNIREIPTGSPSVAKGGPVPSKPVQEVTIAVDPEAVAALHEALAIQAALRPDDVARRLEREVDHVIPYQKNLLIASNVGQPYVLRAATWWGVGKVFAKIINELPEIQAQYGPARNGVADAALETSAQVDKETHEPG